MNVAKKKGKGGGLTPRVYGGLSKARTTRGVMTDRFRIKNGESGTVMFLEIPKDMKEFDQHQFRDRGKWNYVPCAGDDCPLCEDEDSDVAKVHYRFVCNVYNLGTKKCEILEGPKTLAGRIRQRYGTDKKKQKRFLKKTFEISKLDGETVEWDVETSDEDPVSEKVLANLKKHDLMADITGSMERYFGNKLPKKGSKTALDDDDYDEDDEDDEDTEYDEDDLEEMDLSEVRKIAKSLKIKTVDAEGDKRSKAKLIKLIIKAQG